MTPMQLLMNSISELTDTDTSTLSDNISINDADLNSLDYVDIFLRIKKEYGTQIDTEDFSNQNFITLKDMADYINEKINN